MDCYFALLAGIVIGTCLGVMLRPPPPPQEKPPWRYSRLREWNRSLN